MKQLAIDPKLVVDVELTVSASLLKPVVFKEGDIYCCILGINPLEGVFGCGGTPGEAVADWDETLQLRLAESHEGDEVVGYVKEVLSKAPRSKQLQEFYDQLRPVNKK